MAELERGACRDIVKKTCGDKKGDREAFHACMKENKDKFPAECKERFEAMKEKRKEKWKEKRAERKAKREQTKDNMEERDSDREESDFE